jgi:hypothetical protein
MPRGTATLLGDLWKRGRAGEYPAAPLSPGVIAKGAPAQDGRTQGSDRELQSRDVAVNNPRCSVVRFHSHAIHESCDAVSVLPRHVSSNVTVNRRQQIIGRLYLIGVVTGVYLIYAPAWTASSLYQVCCRLFGR